MGVRDLALKGPKSIAHGRAMGEDDPPNKFVLKARHSGPETCLPGQGLPGQGLPGQGHPPQREIG